MKLTAAVLAGIGGGVGFALGVIVLTAATLGHVFFDLSGTWWTIAMIGAGLSVGCAMVALFSAGRASISPSSAVRLQLAVGAAALPVGWGALLLAAALFNHRARHEQAEPLDRHRLLKRTASGLGWFGTVLLALSAMLYVVISTEGAIGLGALALASAAGTLLLGPRPRLGATISLPVAFFAVADSPTTFGALGGAMIGLAGVLAVLRAIRRRWLRLIWGGFVGYCVGGVVDFVYPLNGLWALVYLGCVAACALAAHVVPPAVAPAGEVLSPSA